MTIHHGDCGHIKSHWDNHKKCINCSYCSRESSCSRCSSWSNSIWELAEKRRTYSSRKRVMSSRKKSLDVSLSSGKRKRKHGNTAPYGTAAWGKTLIGGNSTSHWASDDRPTSHRSLAKWTRRHIWPTGHARSPAIGHARSPATSHRAFTDHRQVGDIETSSLPIT